MFIGIGGYATSGKDAVADILVRDHGFYKTYMSAPLEKALLALDPWIPLPDKPIKDIGRVGYWEHMGDDPASKWFRYSVLHARVGYDESKKSPEVRRLLQTMGTEVGRNILGENVWTDAMLSEVVPILKGGQSVVVTGIRFPNELYAVKEASLLRASPSRLLEVDAQLWWVDRGLEPVNGHASDNSLSAEKFDDVVLNKGDLQQLSNMVTFMIEARKGLWG